MADAPPPWRPPEPVPAHGLRSLTLFREAGSLLVTRPGVLLQSALLAAAAASLARCLSGVAGALPSFLMNFLSILIALACLAASAASSQPGRAQGRDLQTFPACLGAAFRRAVPLAALAVPAYILQAFLGLALSVGIGLWRFAETGRGSSALYLLAPMPALLLEAFLAACLCLAPPACALEGTGPLASLRRSFSLTRGSRLKIFAFLLPLLALDATVNLVAALTPFTPGNLALATGAHLVLTLASFAFIAALFRHRLGQFLKPANLAT